MERSQVDNPRGFTRSMNTRRMSKFMLEEYKKWELADEIERVMRSAAKMKFMFSGRVNSEQSDSI